MSQFTGKMTGSWEGEIQRFCDHREKSGQEKTDGKGCLVQERTQASGNALLLEPPSAPLKCSLALSQIRGIWSFSRCSLRAQPLSAETGAISSPLAAEVAELAGSASLTFFSCSWTLWQLSSVGRLAFLVSDSVWSSDSCSSPEDVSFSLIFIANSYSLFLRCSSVVSGWGRRVSLLMSVSDKSSGT